MTPRGITEATKELTGCYSLIWSMIHRWVHCKIPQAMYLQFMHAVYFYISISNVYMFVKIYIQLCYCHAKNPTIGFPSHWEGNPKLLQTLHDLGPG